MCDATAWAMCELSAAAAVRCSLVRAGLRNSAEFQKLDKHIEKERKKRQRMMDPDAPRPFWQVAPFLCIPVLAAFMVHWVIHHIEDYIPE